MSWFTIRRIVTILMSLAILGLLYFSDTGARERFLELNGGLLESFLGLFPSFISDHKAVGRSYLLELIMLAIESWIFVHVLVAVFFEFADLKHGGFGHAMRKFGLLQGTLTSIAMGLYMHVVFWGDVPLVFFTLHAYNPATISFMFAIHAVALPAMIYLLSQTIQLVARPSMQVSLLAIGWLSSIFPVAEAGFVGIRYLAGSYVASKFQQGAIYVWVLMEAIDLLFFVASALLLRRAVGLIPEQQDGH